MSAPYNRFAGLDRDRLAALSDGVFAVAMTLLVLDLRVPTGVTRTSRNLLHALAELGPSLAAYLLSFTMLGTFTASVLAEYVPSRGRSACTG